MKNKVLRLNKELYSYGAISEAVLAFSAISDIRISEEVEYWLCSFFNSKASIGRTISEFENYLIGITSQGA